MSDRSTTRLPDAAEREQQRFAHLVLGQPRPKFKVSAKRKKAKVANVVQLVAGVEERVQLRERWSHKQGTPETHEHVAAEARREGALLRLHATGAIDAHQLAAAEQIATAHRAITADVAVRTAKLEPRGSGGGPDAASAERISAVTGLLGVGNLGWDGAVWQRQRLTAGGGLLVADQDGVAIPYTPGGAINAILFSTPTTGYAGVSYQANGTWSGTVSIEGSNDASADCQTGGTWFGLTSMNLNGGNTILQPSSSTRCCLRRPPGRSRR